jgi:hypothetical protein
MRGQSINDKMRLATRVAALKAGLVQNAGTGKSTSAIWQRLVFPFSGERLGFSRMIPGSSAD